VLGLGATGQFAIGEVDTGAAAGAEFIGPDKYMQRLSEPVRFLPAVRASAQQALAFNPQPVVSFSWFAPLSEPVRQRPRSPAALYPSFFYQPAPSPFVATGWFTPLSEPVRSKPALRTALQSFIAYVPNPATVTPFAWFRPLSEPVRIKPALARALQPFFATDPSVIPLQKLMTWFAPLSEPVRIKPGLRAWLQQFFTGPPRLLPTPTVTGTLSARETKDVFLAGVSAFNPPASAEIGIVDTGFPVAEIGIATPAVASVSISIQII